MKKVLALAAVLLAAVLVFAGCQATEGVTGMFAVTQVGEGQQISVSWNTTDNVTKLDVTVKHGTQTVAQQSFDGAALESKEVVLDAYYGKHDVTVKATYANGTVAEITKSVALSASEYVIAPISGSMPQLYFTLNMDEITANGTIPTFVWLARPDSWNWNNLPTNVYAMPTVALSEVLTHNNYDRMVEATDAYIEELYAINPQAKFNLYINDYNSYLYLKLLAGNGIPESNYYVTLLSDGGASYTDFNLAFNSEDENFDADAKYDEMAAKLATLYTEVRAAKDYGNGTFSVNASEFRQYSYVAAREMNNVEWWILRPRAGVLCSPDTDFIERVLGADKTEGIIEERNFASPLTKMTEEQKTALKALYNFNGEMFEAAEQQGKKAMMILGSWAYAENEPDFDAYVKLIKAYYGDEFVYYYKGHPNTPTSNHPDKQAQLERLGLIDVESSINAELILFFYPDIYMCGYNSSTFMSVESPEMACAMFNMRKDACTGEYKDLIGIYLTKIDVANSEYAELCTEEGHTYFLMEHHNKAEGITADIGIYDETANTFKYYTVTDGTFTEVAK